MLDRTSDLPFWSVLTPETNTTLLLRMAMFSHDMNQTSPKVLSSPLDSLIVHPLVFAPSAGFRFPWSPSQAVVLRDRVGSLFESVVTAGNIVVQVFKKFVCKAPVSVHGTSSIDLGSREWHGVWLTGRRWRLELLGPFRGLGFELNHGIAESSSNLRKVPRGRGCLKTIREINIVAHMAFM